VACGADKIVANPGTSQAVFGNYAICQFRGLLKKIGLKSSVVKSGKFKDIGSR